MHRYKLRHLIAVTLLLCLPAFTCGVGPVLKDLIERVEALEAAIAEVPDPDELEANFAELDAAISESSSNVVFAWSSLGEEEVSAYPALGEQEVLRFAFTKVPAISTVTVNARMWEPSGGIARLTVDIGGQIAIVDSSGRDPDWFAEDIDVSTLLDGATYEGTIRFVRFTGGSTARFAGVTLVSS